MGNQEECNRLCCLEFLKDTPNNLRGGSPYLALFPLINKNVKVHSFLALKKSKQLNTHAHMTNSKLNDFVICMKKAKGKERCFDTAMDCVKHSKKSNISNTFIFHSSKISII